MSNGREQPMFGLGTWLADSPEQLKTALRAAFDVGYHYIDTAHLYKNESVIGEVLQEYYTAGRFQRSDIFLTSKLPYYGHANPGRYLQQSLDALQTDYLDLYLIHMPFPMKADAQGKVEIGADGMEIPEPTPLLTTWRFLEERHKAGTLRAIGLSNINAQQLQEIYDHAEVKPHNLQVELHILHPQDELVALCKKLNMTVTSYGPLGSPGSKGYRAAVHFRSAALPSNCLDNPLVLELSGKYNKSPAQILLRQILQRGITVIPKSVHPARIQENINIFDFEISDEDMKRFEQITDRVQLFPFEFAVHHPNYPWSKA